MMMSIILENVTGMEVTVVVSQLLKVNVRIVVARTVTRTFVTASFYLMEPVIELITIQNVIMMDLIVAHLLLEKCLMVNVPHWTLAVIFQLYRTINVINSMQVVQPI